VKYSSNKWVCKVCGTKQSLLQVYAEGAGAYCREIVQKLNFARGTAGEEQLQIDAETNSNLTPTPGTSNNSSFSEKSVNSNSTENQESNLDQEEATFIGNIRVVPKSRSIWTKYSDTDKDKLEGN